MVLLTEQNTPKVERMIYRALTDAFKGSWKYKRSEWRAFFEHGQWWIENSRTGAQYSVCDASPDTFVFEQVTQGEKY